MVEYHVVRQGVDQMGLMAKMSPRFRKCEIIDYWSNQSAIMQRFGERCRFANTFAFRSTGCVGQEVA